METLDSPAISQCHASSFSYHSTCLSTVQRLYLACLRNGKMGSTTFKEKRKKEKGEKHSKEWSQEIRKRQKAGLGRENSQIEGTG